MPAISKMEAIERLAKAVEATGADDLAEIYAELYPAKSVPKMRLEAKPLAMHIRAGIEPEEVVDLWNVIFPADHDVYYDEEKETLVYGGNEVQFAPR